MALTPKQEKFVQGLFVGLSQRKAWKEAFPDDKSGDATIDNNASNLAKENEIIMRLKELQDEVKSKNIVTVEYVLEGLKEVKERCMSAEPVLDRNGEPTGEYRFDSSGANKSLELIGKFLKMFTDKVETSGEQVIILKGMDKIED